MNAHWKFPSTGGGSISGLNETGITQFKSLPMQSVTKETLQDSLDARASTNKPAIVKFSVFSMPREILPDAEGLTKIFSLGEEYWKNHDEAKKFFTEGKELLLQDTITIMAIQDYNTRGLSNISSSKDGSNTGGWVALVRSTGITEKGPNASGSFGIGKHAPFAASKLQTVIYGTLNEDMKIGFQGVSKIASFKDVDGEITQGTGYFGYVKENDFIPVTTQQDIPSPLRRTQQGTDKFIIGLSEHKSWEAEVLTEAVSSFMMAILENKLEVFIGDFHLNKKTLPQAIEQIEQYSPDHLAIQFYKALTSSNHKKIVGTFKTDDGKNEEIELYLLAAEGLKRRIVLYRGTGMKIYDRGQFRTPIEFSGVMVVKGDRLNAVLRKMEPPTHDKWDPNLFKENVKYAKKLHREINAWLNEQTRNLIDVSDIQSIELKGLEQLLPDVTQKESATLNISEKKLSSTTGKIKKQKKTEVKFQPSGVTDDEGETTDGSPTPSGTPQSDSPKDKKTTESGAKPKARIARIRTFCADADGLYYIRLWPTSTGVRSFKLQSIGENNVRTDVDVIKAILSTGESVPVHDSTIGPISLTSTKLVEIHLYLKNKNKLALEVRPN